MTGVQVLRGVLRPDGSLELASTPELPAGPVEVVLRTVPRPSGENWWEYLQRIRAESEASGRAFRSAEEIHAERKDFRKE